MNRLQNLVLVLWGVLLLLFVAFNWQLVWQPVDLVFLFMDFNFSLLLWLTLAAIGVPLLLRLMGGASARSTAKRSDKEIHVLKAKAFDGMTGEFEKMINQVKDHVDERIRSLTTIAPPPPSESEPVPPPESEPAPPPEKPGADPDKEKGEAWRALTGAAGGEETDTGKAGPAVAEKETGNKKPKRGRKSKA